MQGDLGELALERLALADVSQRQDDLTDRGVVEEVGRDRLHLAPDAGGIPEAPLDRLCDGPTRRDIGDECPDSLRVIGVNEAQDRAAHQP